MINIAETSLDLNDPARAQQESSLAARIADEIGDVQAQNASRHILALTYLVSGELAQARTVALEARKIDYPPNNHAVTALSGVTSSSRETMLRPRKSSIWRWLRQPTCWKRTTAITGHATPRGWP